MDGKFSINYKLYHDPHDIKNFIFHDAIVREETLKEYFDSFGMKFEDSIVFDDFYNMIRNNQKLGKKEKKQKFEFKGDIIEEKNEEEENGGNIDDVVENVYEDRSNVPDKVAYLLKDLFAASIIPP